MHERRSHGARAPTPTPTVSPSLRDGLTDCRTGLTPAGLDFSRLQHGLLARDELEGRRALRDLELLMLLLVHHLDTGDREVVSHSQLRIAIEAYVLLGCLGIVLESPAAATTIGLLRATVATRVRAAAEALDLWRCAALASVELEEQLVYLDVAVVHDKILSQEVLQCISFNDFHLGVPLETINHRVDATLELSPVLLECLDLRLCNRQIFVELL